MTEIARRLLSLVGLVKGEGRGLAPIVWLIMWSRVSWSSGKRETWIGNKRIAKIAGVTVREVQKAKACLAASGKISGKWSRRRGVCVKVWTLAPGVDIPAGKSTNPRFRIPGGHTRTRARGRLRATGVKHTGPAMALAWALYACASLATDARHPEDSTPVKVSMVALREMTGVSLKGGAFYRRLATLERAGVISRVGERWADGITVHADPGARQQASVHGEDLGHGQRGHGQDARPPVPMMDCRPTGQPDPDPIPTVVPPMVATVHRSTDPGVVPYDWVEFPGFKITLAYPAGHPMELRATG